ncbi:MAG: MarR family winged helix-turn-helix transcriptional regulator [Acetobacteraceae bacterium]|nr:MarR family winged helix-turn-helix transcriptional regulator [Acetobacteraceae bacterium]
MADLAPETCSCSALRQASRHITRLYDDALAPVGLGLNQYSILSKLSRLGPKNLQHLADLLVMDRSTLGHLLRPLERRDLPTVGVAEQDRRHRVITLTVQGVALTKQARRLWAKAERRFEHAFGADDALALLMMLRRVTSLELAMRNRPGTPAG